MSCYLTVPSLLLISLLGCAVWRRYNHRFLEDRDSALRMAPTTDQEESGRKGTADFGLQTMSLSSMPDVKMLLELDMRNWDPSNIPVTSLTLMRLAHLSKSNLPEGQEAEQPLKQKVMLDQKYIRRQGDEIWPWRRKITSIN